MSAKKFLIGILTGLGVLVLLSGGFFFLKKKKEEFVSPLSLLPKKEEERLLLWDDPAGFTFQYPQGLLIDPHPEDLEHYAHLKITSAKQPGGKILILVSEAKVKKIEDWVKEEKEATAATIIDTTLADVPAKKLLFGKPKKILTTAIDPYGGLFLLELSWSEGEFWPNVYQEIIKSFAFKPLTEEEKAILEETPKEVIYEEEEVVE